MRRSSNLLTYAGVAITGLGFLLIGYSWSEVAAVTAVPLQLPYIVSGGFTGMGLILVGLTLINMQAKLRDAARRDRQLLQLQDLMDQIRVLLGGDERPGADVGADVDDTQALAAAWDEGSTPDPGGPLSDLVRK